jgi:hypothetical protein
MLVFLILICSCGLVYRELAEEFDRVTLQQKGSRRRSPSNRGATTSVFFAGKKEQKLENAEETSVPDAPDIWNQNLAKPEGLIYVSEF